MKLSIDKKVLVPLANNTFSNNISDKLLTSKQIQKICLSTVKVCLIEICSNLV